MMAVGASCESRPEQLCVALVASASAPSVTKWSQRFDREGLDGPKDKPGRGAKPTIPLATVRRVVEEAGKAPPGRQRWSTRSLAREVGISAHSVARIWQSQGLKPHRLRTFKVSREPLAKLLGCGSAQSSDSQGEHPIVLDFDCVFWS